MGPPSADGWNMVGGQSRTPFKSIDRSIDPTKMKISKVYCHSQKFCKQILSCMTKPRFVGFAFSQDSYSYQSNVHLSSRV